MGRFSGLADGYAKYRPGYPAAAIDCVWSAFGLRPGSVVIDVGSGTGISARLFAERGARVIGIEPNADMRRVAEATPCAGASPIDYREGRGEATGLPDACADAVVSAQAFHWFDAPAALGEFHRVLKPGGGVALIWNERNERDPFTAAYGEVIRGAPGAAEVEVPRGRAGEALLSCPLFKEARRVTYPNSQSLTADALLGRAFSASYAPRDSADASHWADRLRRVFADYAEAGSVDLSYETSAYLATRRGSTD